MVNNDTSDADFVDTDISIYIYIHIQKVQNKHHYNIINHRMVHYVS